MNNNILLTDLLKEVRKNYKNVEGVMMDPKKLIFEERVKMSCYYCGRYNVNWHCPPNIPQIDYQKMFSEFEYGAFVWTKVPLSNPDARTVSSVINHKSLLMMEKYLWEHNNSMALSFIAGSCKLCKNGCGKEKCNNPYQARTPLEATGCNVIRSVAQYGMEVVFPPQIYMLRIGLIVW